jgi:hypothetical protein
VSVTQTDYSVCALLVHFSLIVGRTTTAAESGSKQSDAAGQNGGLASNGTAATAAAASTASGEARSTVPPEGALCKFKLYTQLPTCCTLLVAATALDLQYCAS